MWQGLYTALVTPFRNDCFDRDAFKTLVERQIKAGVDGIVVAGTTGEAPTLSGGEYAELLETAVALANRRTCVLAGVGSNSTAITLEKTRLAADLGVDGLLVVAPYYNKPNRAGMKAHFLAVADRSPVPLMLYNVPGRTASSIEPELALELASHEKIVAIKDASGAFSDCMALAPSSLDVFAGDDALFLPWAAMGAVGVVSVASNAIPAEMKKLVELLSRADLGAAKTLHYRLLPLFRALFVESNPVPVKALLAELGLCTDQVRLPLMKASQTTEAVVRKAWNSLNLRYVEMSSTES